MQLIGELLFELVLRFLGGLIFWIVMFPVVWLVSLPCVMVIALFRAQPYMDSVFDMMTDVHDCWKAWGWWI